MATSSCSQHRFARNYRNKNANAPFYIINAKVNVNVGINWTGRVSSLHDRLRINSVDFPRQLFSPPLCSLQSVRHCFQFQFQFLILLRKLKYVAGALLHFRSSARGGLIHRSDIKSFSNSLRFRILVDRANNRIKVKPQV
jgi:hypothetical protein